MARPKKKTSVKSAAPRAKTVTISSSSSDTTMQPFSAKQLTKVFAVWLIGHSAVVYLANMFFPTHVVLGTNVLSPIVALFMSMLVFTLIVVGTLPIIEYIAEVQKKRLSSVDWMVLFAVINTVGLWVVARFAEQLGLGISSWLVALTLGVIIDMLQGILIMKAV